MANNKKANPATRPATADRVDGVLSMDMSPSIRLMLDGMDPGISAENKLRDKFVLLQHKYEQLRRTAFTKDGTYLITEEHVRDNAHALVEELTYLLAGIYVELGQDVD